MFICSPCVRRVCHTAAVGELWMLEDLEPWPDAPESGGICSPTTLWITPDTMELPDEVCVTITARVEALVVGGRVERVAHIGHGVTTIVGSGDGDTGDVELTGCLLWDHYLWMDFHTEPTGQLRMTRRGSLIQRAISHPTRNPHWFSVTYEGPIEYWAAPRVKPGYDIRWRASTVSLGAV